MDEEIANYLTLIGALISLIAIIAFFVLCYNVGKIKSMVERYIDSKEEDERG